MDEIEELTDEELESVVGGATLSWGSCSACLKKTYVHILEKYDGLCRTCANAWRFE